MKKKKIAGVVGSVLRKNMECALMVLRISGMFSSFFRSHQSGSSLESRAAKIEGLFPRKRRLSTIHHYISKDDLEGFLNCLKPEDLSSIVNALTKKKDHPFFDNPLEGTPDWAVDLFERKHQSRIGEFLWTVVDKKGKLN